VHSDDDTASVHVLPNRLRYLRAVFSEEDKVENKHAIASDPTLVTNPGDTRGVVDDKAMDLGYETVHSRRLLQHVKLGKSTKAGKWVIRLTRVASLTTSAGGLMQLITLVYPTQMSRGTNLVTAFREARLLKTRITYDSLTGTSPTTPFTFLSGFDYAATTGTSAFQPDMLENSKLFAITDNKPMRNVHKNTQMVWSNSDTTPTGTDPTGGIAGGWIHYALNTTPNSTAVLTYLIECWYELRELR